MGFGRGKGFSPPKAVVEEHTTKNITCVEPQIYRPVATNTWEDFDLSPVVPKGATGAVFHLINTDPGLERDMGLRKKGSTDNYFGCLLRSSHTWAMVGLDENRKCQGYFELVDHNWFLLVGYTGENYVFFDNGHDITPTTQGAWVDTDLSSYCPGAIGAIVELANESDWALTWGLRKHGSADDRHLAGRHTWAVIGLDANQHLDIYYDDFPRPAKAFNLIGYVKAGVTFYTNGNDITPAADGTYKIVSLIAYKTDPVMAFIELDCLYANVDWAIRKNRYCGDIYGRTGNHNFAIVHPNTPNATLRIKLENAATGLFLVGIA